MIYLRTKKEDFADLLTITEKDVKIDIYEDMFYSTCPNCGKERNVDLETIQKNLETDGDFSSTSFYCRECNEKILKEEKEKISKKKVFDLIYDLSKGTTNEEVGATLDLLCDLIENDEG